MDTWGLLQCLQGVKRSNAFLDFGRAYINDRSKIRAIFKKLEKNKKKAIKPIAFYHI